MSKHTTPHGIELSEAELSEQHHTTPVLKPRKPRASTSHAFDTTVSATVGAAKKRKHARIAPAAQSKYSMHELFGTDSEDDDEDDNDQAREQVRKTPPPQSSLEVRSKKAKKPSSASRQNLEGSTAAPAHDAIRKTSRDLFGTDSDDDNAPEMNQVLQYPRSPANEAKMKAKQIIECQKCRIEMPRNEYRYHLRSNLHKSNCLSKTEFENIDIVATAFKNRIVTYRLNSGQGEIHLTPEGFLSGNRKELIELIELSLKKQKCIKLNFELFAYFNLPKSNERQLKSFNTKYEIIYQSTDLNETFLKIIDKFKSKLSEFEQCESGWTCLSISHLEININKNCPIRGGTYLDLPQSIKKSKSCINIQNTDNHCFLWCVVAALFPSENNVCRVKAYPHYSSVLSTKGMTFPPT